MKLSSTWSRWFIIVMTIAVFCPIVRAADKGNFSVAPSLKNGQKWRIGYYEGGEYIEYQQTLIATINGLMELGWLEQTEIPKQQGEQTHELWNWLASNAKSDYIEFVGDAYYSAEWDKKRLAELSSELINRLNTKQDLDLMIAMGTWTGLELANDKHHTNTIALAVNDAVSAGIVKSIEDSGYDYIHARVDPNRYERQIRIFHDIIGFQTLGVAYDNSIDGRSYAAIADIEKVAQEIGFEIVSCYVRKEEEKDTLALEEQEKREKACFHQLGKEANAIYVTVNTAVNSNTIPELVDIANSYKIPTFSQAGSSEVKAGFLLSIAVADFKYVGKFHAETIAKVFNGAKPRQLDQIFEDPPKIAINLKTAEMIGYDPPVDVLGAADEIYQEIITPE